MTPQDEQRIFLDDLARRWRREADRIVELATDGALPLWIGFADVYVQKTETTTSRGRKKKAPEKKRCEWVEVQPSPEVLAQIRGRCDRMLIAAELPCLDENNKPVTITNSVGEEWGETSMIGLKPAALFARTADVARFERKNSIVPRAAHLEQHDTSSRISEASSPESARNHPCFAPELHAASACWHALFDQPGSSATGIKKADILAWLEQHNPDLSRAARERIALVVTPSTRERR